MSFIKKLVGFLFEEEEEIEEEGELEEISIKEAPKPKVRTYEDESLESIKKSAVKESIHVESAVMQPVQKVEEKKFTSIEITEEKPAASRKPVEKAAAPRKKVHVEQTKQEYEFTPVISPIFGASETSKQAEKKQNGSKGNMVQRKPSAKKTSPYGEILSPMYGMEMPQMEKEAEIEQEELQEVVEIQGEETSNSVESKEVLEEETAIPLAELLCEEKPAAQGDDLLQISLFGDDVIVRTDQQEDSYTIEE